MKNLNDYIIELNYENYLLERLCTHCSLEYKWTHSLDPRFTFYNSIYESLGKFDNAGKVVKHICDVLKNNYESQIIDCKEDNVFFDFVDINIKEGLDSAEYYEYKNNTLYIALYCSIKVLFIDNIDAYAKLILHELLHGYEDYNRIKTGKPTLLNIDDPSYYISTRYLNSFNEIKNVLSRCKYFLNAQERNAYFSGLEDDIIKLIKTNNYYLDKFDYNKFKSDLKKTNMWEVYYQLSVFINNMNNLDNDKKQRITDIYNQIFKDNKTFNNIYKEFKVKWRKFDSKFNQLVPKILCNNMSIKESKEFTFTVNKLNKLFEL